MRKITLSFKKIRLSLKRFGEKYAEIQFVYDEIDVQNVGQEEKRSVLLLDSIMSFAFTDEIVPCGDSMHRRRGGGGAIHCHWSAVFRKQLVFFLQKLKGG
jgi:hypothetical protein